MATCLAISALKCDLIAESFHLVTAAIDGAVGTMLTGTEMATLRLTWLRALKFDACTCIYRLALHFGSTILTLLPSDLLTLLNSALKPAIEILEPPSVLKCSNI